ncbi:MAG: hypothetical protein JKY42_00410 [Flavobacteriales bacterium]|nr:hypothetical protein [Flavobacteriales bacterium]
MANDQITRRKKNLETVLKPTIIIILSLLLGVGYAQEGNPFISNYSFSSKTGQLKVQDLVQDNTGALVLATPKGLATFDGVQWGIIKMSAYPLQLHLKGDRVYVATSKGFGYAVKNETGLYEYTQLSDSSDNDNSFWSIQESNEAIFFCGSEKIVRYSEKENTVVRISNAEEEIPFLGTFLYKEKLYVNLYKKGFYGVDREMVSALKTPSNLVEAELIFTTNHDSISILGMDDNTIWRFDGNTFTQLSLECEEYLSESEISGGVSLSGGRLAISTSIGGCVIVDLVSGKTLNIINYQTGLADDEVFAMTTDRNGGLWLAHEFGLSRANLHFPVKDYSTYPGLEGNLLSLYIDNNDLYVATSEGVFYLDDVKDYREIEVFIKKQMEKAIPIETNYIAPIIVQEKHERKQNAVELTKKQQRRNKRKDKRNRKKKRPEDTEVIMGKEDSVTVAQAKIDQPEEEYTYQPEEIEQSQMIYALQSIKYLFKPVTGIEDKCKELLSVGKYIIVAGNKGLYAISEGKAKTIVSGKYINKLYKSRYNNRVYVGAAEGFFSVIEENGKWNIEEYFEKFENNIISVVERDNHNLWLGSENVAYKVHIDDEAKPIEIKAYYFDTETTEEVYVREIYGKPFFFLRSGIYGFDAEKDSIYYNEEVNNRFFNRYRYIFSQNTITWILSNNEWVNINHEPELLSLKSFYLNLFDDIQNIFVDENQNLWIIDGSNKLYYVEATNIPPTEKKFDIFFTQVKNTNGLNFTLTNLNFDYDNSSLTFNVSAPYFVKADGTVYQYKIEGLMNEWSEWSSNANINFPFIPEGKYVIKVRAKNVFGQESDVKELKFVIQPPFYRTTWFYILGLIVGVGVLVGVVKLRERRLKRAQYILEEKVKLRTQQLNIEKQKSDDLLLNILPQETAEELKTKGKATARYYNLTTVLFTDFKGFTQISESITPVELVKELDECFIGFDQIIEDNNIEKIKTIGDAYMCVGGVPSRNQSNPIEAVLAGLAIADFMDEMKNIRTKEGKPFWELRLGIHTGPLIAGVVGKKKFAYDVWGDTVNTASRMESSGEPGKVNISAATHELIKKYFKCTSRGRVAAKNKGNLEMYFVECVKADYASDKKGRKPNSKLMQIINDLR